MSCPCEAAEVVNDLPCERLLPSILSKTTGDRLKIRILSGLTHIVFVTTPHAYKAGASGMTLVCRPIPIVRFNHRSETNSKQLLSRLARADV
jgi:hypothetical protein